MDIMDEYKHKLINNMKKLRYWVRYSEENGYNTHIVFFKRPGRDGSGFEDDKTALKNIIRIHEKIDRQLCELTAVVFNEATFQVYWHDKYLADHVRKLVKEQFGDKCMIIYRLP